MDDKRDSYDASSVESGGDKATGFNKHEIEKTEIPSKTTARRKKSASFDVRRLTYLGIMTAIVFVLQYLSFFTRFGTFSLTFVLVPIVIGVALCGFSAGPWLGFVFSIAVLASGDAALFLGFDAFGTVVTVILKGTFAGAAGALCYKLLGKVNRYLAVVVAAIVTPIVNTGIFFLGCVVFFFDDIAAFWQLSAKEVVPFVIMGLIGINFIIEVVVNLVLVPVVYRIIQIKKK